MRWYAGMIGILGVSGVAMAWAPNAAVGMLFGIPLGLGGAGMVTAMNAISQAECPPEMRGRILALTAVAFLGSTPIGGPITGWIGDNIGPEWSLAYGSIITIGALARAGVVERSAATRSDSRIDAARSLLGAPNTIAPDPAERA